MERYIHVKLFVEDVGLDILIVLLEIINLFVVGT